MSTDKALWEYYQTKQRSQFESGRSRLDFLVRQIKKVCDAGNVLEIGFGDGYLLEKISSNRKFSLFGVDISEKNVELIQRYFTLKGIEADLRVGEIDRLPFPDNVFDVIIATEVLEHLDDKTLRMGLDEIRRVLKPGGLLIGTVPANENLQDNTVYCPQCGNVFHRWGHKQGFTKNKLEELFENRGFVVKSLKYVTFFGERLTRKTIGAKLKLVIRKLLFTLLRRIFAPNWWFFFEVKKPLKVER